MNNSSSSAEVEQDHNVLKDSISNKLYFGSLYSVSVGVLFLWGYWTSFGVNILEFLDLTDIIKVTAYPIAAFASLAGLGVTFGVLTSPASKRIRDSSNGVPSDERADDSSRQNFVSRIMFAIVEFIENHFKAAKVLYAIILTILVISDWEGRWAILSILITIPFAVILFDLKLLAKTFPNFTLRIIASSLLPLIFSSSFFVGQVQSKQITHGKTYRYVTSEIKGYPYKSPTSALRYVGHAGDYLFFYEPTTDATLITKFEDTPLTLKEFKEDSQQISFWEKIKILLSSVTKSDS